jgi:allantoicase
MSEHEPKEPQFTDRIDLASERLGGAVIATDDDFFAEKENLLKPYPAEWKAHAYTDRGKWMDGWESRRKRLQGDEPDAHDWAIVRLGAPGIIRGVVVDTAFFRGNYPDACMIEACAAPTDAFLHDLEGPGTSWVEIVPRSKLNGDSRNPFPVSSTSAFTHVRLNIYPDGGVARLRVHGDVLPDWRRIGHARGEVDLAHIEHGGDVLLASDMFFGERRNLIMPGRAVNMSDGWETRRRRGPGHDWAIVKLGATGSISRVEIDTNHFKGNFPDTCSLEAIVAPAGTTAEQLAASDGWKELLSRRKLQAHTRHLFEPELADLGPVTHVRVRVFPDGGISRLRVWGTLDDDARRQLGVQRLDALPEAQARAELHACNASTRWVDAMLAAWPFGTPERVLEVGVRAWSDAGPDDWREAMAGHPRIGQKAAAGSEAGVARGWSSKEQAGMAAADEATRHAMAEANAAYEARFGFIYLVCATGRSAGELLATARARLANTPEVELPLAAAELGKITTLRLEKLLQP